MITSTLSSTLKADNQYPLTTVGALVEGPSGRVLIVKTNKWKGAWGVPGGKVDWGETLQQALLREFKEEVNLNLFDVRYALTQEAVIDQQFVKAAHFILINYFARSNSESIEPNGEIVEWIWLDACKALHYPLNTYTRLLINNYLTKLT